VKVYRTLIIFLLISCGGAETPAEGVINKDLSVEEFNVLMDSKQGVIIDVRTADEYQEGHLEGAVNIDYYGEDFGQKLDRLNKEDVYFVYCGSGGRSSSTLELMVEKRFKEVYNMEGGFNDWSSKGLPYK